MRSAGRGVNEKEKRTLDKELKPIILFNTSNCGNGPHIGKQEKLIRAGGKTGYCRADRPKWRECPKPSDATEKLA